MMDEPRFAQPIPNVTVAVGRDANLPCVVEHLGTYKVLLKLTEKKLIFKSFFIIFISPYLYIYIYDHAYYSIRTGFFSSFS